MRPLPRFGVEETVGRGTREVVALVLLCCVQVSCGQTFPTLTWATNSSIKLQQLIGEEGTNNGTGFYATDTDRETGLSLLNQTYTLYAVGGTDLGYAFETGNNQLIFLFGDTLYLGAGDVMAWSSTTSISNGLLLNFFTNADGTTLLVQPPGINMGPFNVPDSGITLGTNTYVVCKTGHTAATLDTNDLSILTRFDEAQGTFTPLRILSSVTNGDHFLELAMYQVAAGFGRQEPTVYLWGEGKYRASDIYFASVPASNFETGAGTLYFTGLTNGQPSWSSFESNAVPVVVDNPTNGLPWPKDFPTVGNISVIYESTLGLWLMTYDGGRQKPSTTGVYFSYAPAPWGPWSTNQLIFNARRDGGAGSFIRSGTNGPAGPTIGGADPITTDGGTYAPYLLERFTRVTGNRLRLYYTLSTWNPYTVVLMQSDFTITPNQATPENWVGTWGASLVPPSVSDTNNAGFTNQTVRMIAHTSRGGSQVRVRLGNTFGSEPLMIGEARIAVAGADSSILPATDTALTFSGNSSVTIPAGGLAVSDPAPFLVPPLTNLAVSLFIPAPAGPATWHPEANETNYVSTPGDFAAASPMPVDHAITSCYYLSDIEVPAASGIAAVVTLGDSITDGFHSTIGANHRWPDFLATQLGAAGPDLGVINAGIAGNELLQDTTSPGGLSRFDRDVLNRPGVGYATVLLGVNDIGHSPSNQLQTSAQLIAGYLQLADKAHAQGLKIFAGTLTPFGGSAYASTNHEALREQANAFIRTNTVFDGCIDFDAALRDPAHPKELLTNFDSGDHLHPNDAGYQMMAATVNLSSFQGSTAAGFRPVLTLTQTGNQVLFSWPEMAGGFVLQETSSLTAPAAWQHSPLIPTLENGIFTVSIPSSSAAARFFRVITTP